MCLTIEPAKKAEITILPARTGHKAAWASDRCIMVRIKGVYKGQCGA